MATQPETLVTEEMVQRKGVFSEPRVAPPIALSDIRKWGIAVYWPETPPKLHWDEDYARTTRHGGVIAPLDFNPFAWPIDREPPTSGRATAAGAGVGTRGMNGGQTEEYYAPMKSGDVISSTTGLTEWTERQTRLGLTLFTTTETRWTNQDGELVKVKKSIGIRY
ncbi:MAG: MaoC family dehydratase N-terminal domain-containing protein [SAR202 cluster bacterium]|nr:MaoC family dehydratase N-terminal domain-containing protein [SAR202 cluster bacterium]MDP6664354.1 MaoC family dehydratase N-terminal domain-containing protein [SAR202 cluster bacterium]MDP6798829.1 MaoC family dehydratase N-terminal domain-containing protein [SAR202 cluster bacterium]